MNLFIALFLLVRDTFYFVLSFVSELISFISLSITGIL